MPFQCVVHKHCLSYTCLLGIPIKQTWNSNSWSPFSYGSIEVSIEHFHVIHSWILEQVTKYLKSKFGEYFPRSVLRRGVRIIWSYRPFVWVDIFFPIKPPFLSRRVLTMILVFWMSLMCFECIIPIMSDGFVKLFHLINT